MQLVPAVHVSTWGRPRGGLERRPIRDNATCRHCGLKLHGWGVAPLVGEGEGDGGECCPLCALPSSLDRPSIDQEAVLIWLPEIQQRALTPLVRAGHLVLHEAGVSPTIDRVPIMPLSDPAQDALTMLAALRQRSSEVATRLGTSSPRVLGAAVLEATARRAEPLPFGGIRVLPLGRWIENGQDLYPQVLATRTTIFPGS